jgi:hypothetical protein
MRCFAGCLVAGLIAVGPVFSGEDNAALALNRLRQHSPDRAWSPDALRVDIDGDRLPDFVFIAQDSASVSVAIVLGRKTRQVTIETFAVASSDQNALCAMPASIVSESLDYDPTDAVGVLSGFVRSKHSTGFILSDGQCDPFHFFWNKTQQRLDWWRL